MAATLELSTTGIIARNSRFRSALLRMSEATGWRRNMLLFVVGLFAALAFPPFGILPFLLVGFGYLLTTLNTATRSRRAFADGWWFTYGMHVAGMYWIAISLLVDAEHFAWMIPFAVFGLTGFLALYGGLATYITWRLPLVSALQRIIAFALIWTGTEILRGYLLTGFPWNIAGNGWSQWEVTLQPASLVGAYGLSLWTALCGGLLAWPYLRYGLRASDAPREGHAGLRWCVLLLLPLLIYGAMRVATAPDYRSPLLQQPGVQLRLVQPSIPQSLKWDVNFARETVKIHLQLTGLENSPRPTHAIWPEAALPFRLSETPALVRDIASVAPENGWVLTGGTRVTRDAKGEAQEIFNAMELVESEGALRNLYDKMSLVPFGEFVPFRSILPIDRIVPGGHDFSSGVAHGPIGLPGLPPAAPLICYEIIFPGLVRAQANPNAEEGRAQWILNITNDAWFGTSSGPFQHYGMARMRAAELGLPLVRVANNGITAITDPYGREMERLPLNARGVMDYPLPKALNEPTFYARHGNWPLAIIAGLLLLIGFADYFRRRL